MAPHFETNCFIEADLNSP